MNPKIKETLKKLDTNINLSFIPEKEFKGQDLIDFYKEENKRLKKELTNKNNIEYKRALKESKNNKRR